jgi:hypothetical protein
MTPTKLVLLVPLLLLVPLPLLLLLDVYSAPLALLPAPNSAPGHNV